MDVTEETPDPFETDKSQVRQYRNWLHQRNEQQLEILSKVESALEKMEKFSRSKKNMHLPIRDGIQEMKKGLGALRYDIDDTVCYLDSFEYLMRGLMVRKIKEVKPPKNKGVVDEGSQTLPEPAARSTPDTRKRRREQTVSPEVPVVTKPMEKRPKASKKEEEWVVVPSKKHLRKKREKKPCKTPEQPRRARPEAVLIKPAEGMSYATILRELKKRVNPDELGATVQGIREMRSKDLLVEMKCSAKSRGRLDTAFKEVIGARGTVRHLIPRIEVEIVDLEPTIEVKDVEDAVRSLFDKEPELELRVSLSKTPYRGNRKAYVLLEEARALKLLKGAHIKIGWVSCRVRRKKEVNRCFRCLGFGHIAADCRGPDRSRCCWRCGEEGHLAGSCIGKPRCFLCAAKEEKPRNDHIPGTMRCAAFREAAPNRKP